MAAKEHIVSRSTPRRGGFVPLLVVGVIALVVWMMLSRPAAAPQATTTTPVATTAPTTIAATEETAPAAEASPTTPAETQADAAAEPPTIEAPAALAEPTKAPTNTPKPAKLTATPTRGPPARIDGLPVITLDELPPEALETLALIENDGPFPFSKDGSTFQNRERLLPRQPTGYYREYTVITPGEDDRGARRIVGGEEGELYYTDDHYASFARIWLP